MAFAWHTCFFFKPEASTNNRMARYDDDRHAAFRLLRFAAFISFAFDDGV